MKTKLLFFATFIITVSFIKASAQTAYKWEYVNSLQNEWLQKICTQGLDTVYIVGRNGLIAKSTDRTSTWMKQYPVSSQLNDIIFCNHTTGFAVGNNGTILRTTDAGISWTPMNSGVTVNLNAIAATDINNIWVVGDSGKVVYSTNTGTTWQKKDFSTLAQLNDISFRNNVGYIVGNAHTCFLSTDYGNNWATKNILVYNYYNDPITMFELKSVNQTQNHICILVGADFRGHTINIDNSTLIQVLAPGGFVTSFAIKNDSIGYGFWGGCTTGSSGCQVYIHTINILKTQDNIASGFGTTPLNLFDMYHSDVNIVNDSIGYVVSGASFLHLKRYIPDIYDGLSNRINNKLSIENSTTNLTVRFGKISVGKVEILSITGLKILSENVSHNESSKTINITSLPRGTYIIRAYNRNNTFTNIKWIRQ